jgi:hypothetical protein
MDVLYVVLILVLALAIGLMAAGLDRMYGGR